MFLRAAVILPRDFDREPDRRYPLRVHIGGFGARYTDAARRMAEGSRFRSLWLADETPAVPDALSSTAPARSATPIRSTPTTTGPMETRSREELIPQVERTYRGIGTGDARVLDGGSTGGWVSLALQVFYPDSFNGCWSFCPDSVDFRSFQLVNIYEDANAYAAPDGSDRPAFRRVDGSAVYSMRDECQLENALGLGDSWTMSGGQWGSWNATYGPRGPDGRPVPLWDPQTGVIDRSRPRPLGPLRPPPGPRERTGRPSARSSAASSISGSARPTTSSSKTPSTGSTPSCPDGRPALRGHDRLRRRRRATAGWASPSRR